LGASETLRGISEGESLLPGLFRHWMPCNYIVIKFVYAQK